MYKRLIKGNNRTVFGVCSGLAEYFDIDVTLVKIIFICLIFGTVYGLLLYILLAVCMPNQ